MYKRLIAAFVCIFALLGLSAGQAAAGGYGNPYFKWVNVQTDDEGNLVVEFKEKGLKPYEKVDVRGVATAKVKWACVKHGEVKSIEKETFTVSAEAGAPGRDRANSRGVYKGTIVFEVPDDLACDKGDPVVIKVKWCDLYIKDFCNPTARYYDRGPWKFHATLPDQEEDCGCELAEAVA